QQSHLSISDELLNFFLEESSTTGAGGDEHHRQRVRAAARGKVGFDPFDESPIKRRGEDHMYDRTPGSTPVRDDVYSPSTSNIPETRSRENTPETPLPSRQSPSVRSSAGRRNVVRGSSAYADEALRRGSPLAKSSTAARGDDDVVSSNE
ncbi:RanGTP-binding protein, partial [Aspergillus sp. HF37]